MVTLKANQFEARIDPQKPWQLGALLIDQKIVSEDVLKNVIADLTRVPSIIISQLRIPGYIAKMIPREKALELQAIPITMKTEGGKEYLYVAFFDPSSQEVIDQVEQIVNRPVKPIVAGYKEINTAIQRHLKAINTNTTASYTAIDANRKRMGTAQPEPQRNRSTSRSPAYPPPPDPMDESDLSIGQDETTVVTPRKAIGRERRMTSQGMGSENDFSDVSLGDDELLEEPEVIGERDISASDIELVISDVKEETRGHAIDFSNRGSSDPTGHQADDYSDIIIPSATQMLDLPVGGSSDESSENAEFDLRHQRCRPFLSMPQGVG